MRASSRKLLVAAIGLAVVGFVIYRSRNVFHFGDFSGAKLLHALREANFAYLAISLVAIYVCYGLRSVRWQLFQQNLGRGNFWTIYAMTLAGFASLFLLGRAGEPVRPLLLARKERLPIAGMFGVYALERLFDMAATAVIAGIGLFLFQSRATESQTAEHLQTAAKTTGTLLFVGVFTAVVFLAYLRLHGTALLQRRVHGVVEAHGWRARLARIVLGFVHGVQTIRDWRELALAILYSGVHWFLVLCVYYWVAHAFGGTLASLSLSDAMLVMVFTSVGSAVQAPGVGGGSQLATILVFTKVFKVEPEPATAAAIVIWLITFAAVSLAGVPLLIHQGWSLGQLREMAKHEEEVADNEVRADESGRMRGESAE
jgi:glycosyltransferase 2 family protein